MSTRGGDVSSNSSRHSNKNQAFDLDSQGCTINSSSNSNHNNSDTMAKKSFLNPDNDSQDLDLADREVYIRVGAKGLHPWNNDDPHANTQQQQQQQQVPVVVELPPLPRTMATMPRSEHHQEPEASLHHSLYAAQDIQAKLQAAMPTGSSHAPQVPARLTPHSLHASVASIDEEQPSLASQPAMEAALPIWCSQNHKDEEAPSSNSSFRARDKRGRHHHKSGESGLVEARIVSEEEEQEESMQLRLQEAQQVSPDEVAEDLKHKELLKKKEVQYRRLVYCCIVGAIVLVGGALAGVGLATRGDEVVTAIPTTLAPTMEPSLVQTTAAPTPHLNLFLADLPEYSQKSLQNVTTPQWKAFNWLSHHTNISSMPDWRKTQLFALATFFFSFEGESWPDMIKDRWMDDAVNECYWFSSTYGMFLGDEYLSLGSLFMGIPSPCNSQGEFQALNLEFYASLTASIPPEMSLLTSLSFLRLCWNYMSVPVTNMLPSELVKLTNLTYLDLSGNILIGQVPTELGLMTHLTSLELSMNSLTGSLPTELDLMTNVKLLGLGGNLLTGWLPSELGLLTSMTRLDISENSLSGPLPSELGRMSKLLRLWLDSSSLSGVLPTELGLMTGMDVLTLSENALTGSLPSELAGMANVTLLLAYSNYLTGLLPSELGLMTSMTRLDLSWNSLFGPLPSELGLMTSLECLYLANNSLANKKSLNGVLPTELGVLTSMTDLDFSGNSLSGSLPSELGKMTNMEFLYLANNFFTGTIGREVGRMTSLEALDIAGNSFHGEIPSELGLLTKLTFLDLSNLTHVTGSVPSELSLLKALGHLDLNGSSDLFGAIPSGLCRLQKSFCTFLDFSGETISCTLGMDCNGSLCGCDCPCSNSSSNETDEVPTTIRRNSTL